MSAKIKIPILLILAVIMILTMLRLSVWQLDRAEQKQITLDQVKSRASEPSVELQGLSSISDKDQYRNVTVKGRYLHDKSIYVDNQVVEGQVGYLVFTPLLIEKGSEESDGQKAIMVNRGWLSVGESREQLPTFVTANDIQTLDGRLNTPPAQPPLWDDNYPVAQGKLWAYLPLDEYASQMQLKLLPLVLELAAVQSTETDKQFKRVKPEINDQWVAKHKGYAFQWLMMAIAFFVACCVLLLRTMATSKRDNLNE